LKFLLLLPPSTKLPTVKDRDFKGDDPSLGFSTVWIDNPTTDKFQVGVRYCLPDNSLTDPGVYLRSIELMSDNQPLVKIDRLVFATSVQEKLLRSGYYSEEFNDPFWDDGAFYGQFDPFWGNVAYRYDDPPVDVSPSSCSAGSSRFDLSPLANAIAQLPSKELQVRLVFSDGETSNWHLGEKTVQALKELLQIQKMQTNSLKQFSTNPNF
jgi:hypothetical protein